MPAPLFGMCHFGTKTPQEQIAPPPPKGAEDIKRYLTRNPRAQFSAG
jgi:hypothetical protein